MSSWCSQGKHFSLVEPNSITITTEMYESVFTYSLLMARLEGTGANIPHYKFNLRAN
jgi:hypothetical protein